MFNAGVDGSIVVGKLVDQQNTDCGVDAQSLQYVDLVDAGIVDPTKVVRLALQDAASIAGLLITTEVMVAGRPEDNPNLLFNDSASAARLPTPRHDGEVSLQHAVGTWRSNRVFALRGTDTRRGRTAAHAGGRVNAGSSTSVAPSSS